MIAAENVTAFLDALAPAAQLGVGGVFAYIMWTIVKSNSDQLEILKKSVEQTATKVQVFQQLIEVVKNNTEALAEFKGELRAMRDDIDHSERDRRGVDKRSRAEG